MQIQKDHIILPFMIIKLACLGQFLVGSKLEKYERIIQNRQKQHKPNDTVKVVKIFGKIKCCFFKICFLLQNTILKIFILKADKWLELLILKLSPTYKKNAHKVISLLRRGIKFTPTQPDAMRIEKLMSELTECDCKEQRI